MKCAAQPSIMKHVVPAVRSNVAFRAESLKSLLLPLAIAALVVLAPRVVPATSVCHPQAPQRFLMRSSYVKNGVLNGRLHRRAVEYRVKTYGHIPGMGQEGINSKAAASFARTVRFFGLPVTVHEKIVTPLHCVERRIRQVCTGPSSRYKPRAIGGLRTENTIRGGEISNHLFGIAIDIDPNRNPCCHCVKKWQANPKCKVHADSPYDRADLPRCWVKAFERYGFYWLGNDQLEDTMHFEYLGDPDRYR